MRGYQFRVKKSIRICFNLFRDHNNKQKPKTKITFKRKTINQKNGTGKQVAEAWQ